MKRLLNIFVVLLAVFLWYNNTGAQKINGSNHFVSLSTINRNFNENSAVFNSNHISSDPFGEKPDTLKKKLVKGIEQNPFFVSDESSFRLAIKESKSQFFSKTTYSSCLFSGNGKRGPPSIYSVI